MKNKLHSRPSGSISLFTASLHSRVKSPRYSRSSNKTKLLSSFGTRKLVFIIVSVVLFLALTQLAISHQLANTGEKIRQLEEETALLEEENRVLVEQTSKLSSLSRISLQAEKVGFLRTTRVLHLTPQVSVALK